MRWVTTLLRDCPSSRSQPRCDGDEQAAHKGGLLMSGEEANLVLVLHAHRWRDHVVLVGRHLPDRALRRK
jgi:hypothetical protein